MQTVTRQKYFYYLALILMASTFLRVLFNNLPPVVRSHHFWSAIWIVSLIFFYPQIFTKKAMVYVLFYGIVIYISIETIWSNIDFWNYKRLLFEFYEITIGISVITYFQQSKDFIGLARITLWSIFFLFITAIMSIFSSAIDPMYARDLTALSSVTNESEREAILSFQVYGGGTYSTAAAFMCLFPGLIYYYKNIIISPLSKIQIIIFTLTLFFALFGMQIFGNILIGVVFSVIALLGVRKIRLSILLICFFFSIIIIIPKEVYVKSLITVGDLFDKDSELNYKFNDLAVFIETGADIKDNSTGVAGRAERYPSLFQTYMKGPLMGCFFFTDESANGYNRGGAHLYWMNKLTTTGIIGLIFFMYIPFNFIRNSLKQFNSAYKFYYFLASLSILSYGLVKVVAGRDTWYSFFILLPGLYYLPLLRKEKKSEVSNIT